MTKRAPKNQAAGKRVPKKRAVGGGAGRQAGMNDTIRAEIVTRLAMFDTVSEVRASLLERGIDIALQSVSNYNPLNASSNVAQKWKMLFDKTREDFLKEIAAEPIANRAYRLRKLGQLLEKEIDRGNTAGARATLEQAAKETGNVFTNVAKVQGAKLPGQVPDTADFTPQERRNMLSDRLGEALQKIGAQKSPTVQ